MAVCRSLFVDRTAKIKHFDDSSRTKIEILTDNLYQLRIGYFTCSKCFHMNRSRMCNTNCIGKLDLTLVCQSCCNDILCNITCCIGSRTVNLCAVLSRESAAAVTSCSTIGIYDDLTSGKTAVSIWSTDNETSGRIDKVLGIFIHHVCRDDLIKYIFFDIRMDLLLSYIRVMLSGAYYRINTAWLAILIVLYCNLSLSIWS